MNYEEVIITIPTYQLWSISTNNGGVNDWQYGTQNSSNNGYAKKLLTQPQLSVCAPIGKQAIQPIFTYKPINSWYPPGGETKEQYITTNINSFEETEIACSYNLSDFQTFGSILQYQRTFQASDHRTNRTELVNDILNNQILPYFCSLESYDCPLDPLSNPSNPSNLASCSRFISTDPEGDICRSWAASYPEQADSIKTFYCHQPENIYASECACVNKLYYPLYQTVKRDISAPDLCFWFPCSNTSQFIVPSVETPNNVECPSLCGLIINNFNGADIVFDEEAEIYVNCLYDLEETDTTKNIKTQQVIPGSSNRFTSFINSFSTPSVTVNTYHKERSLSFVNYEIPVIYWIIIGFIGFVIIIMFVIVNIKIPKLII